MTLPTTMTADGLAPISPADLRSALVTSVASTNPGFTANLPGSLIEDIVSTDVGAMVTCDQARVDLVNSVTPYGANEFLLNQLGQIYGVTKDAATNTSVNVVFHGSPGYVIPAGFTVSDGTHQYIVRKGGVIGASGYSSSIYCTATVPGSWAVPAGSVTTLSTSLPTGISMTVTNPETGTPGAAAQTWEDYRAQVLQAGLATAQGVPAFVKTLLSRVPGVQQRLVSIRQSSSGRWKIICGGGDPYEVAYAIFQGVPNINNIVGSVLNITSIRQGSSTSLTTELNHGLKIDDVCYVNGATGMTEINGLPLTVLHVASPHTVEVNVDSTRMGVYTGGGALTPNDRSVTVTLYDYPDNYAISFISPPQQNAQISITWGTNSTNVVSPSAIASLGSPAVVNYINNIPAGAPINLFELQDAFQNAVSPALPKSQLTRIVITVTIDGVTTAPSPGTGIIQGDTESYFYTTSAGVSITQG